MRGRKEDTDTDAVYIKKVGLRKGVVVGLREGKKGKRRKEATPAENLGAVSDPCRDGLSRDRLGEVHRVGRGPK